MESKPPAAHWVWCDDHGRGRNVFVRFRRVLHLVGEIQTADFALFGDARWRLRVNEQIVAYGPGRFVPTHPEFDRLDLRPWLRTGDNELLVEVWSPGSSTFQTMPESAGGFIAWGTVRTSAGEHGLATPGRWQVQPATAWDPQAPAYSFAQGPVEILDQRIQRAEETWFAPVLRAQGPWGDLQPRSIPPLGLGLREPVALPLVATLIDDEIRISGRRQRREDIPAPQRFPYAIELTSPCVQTVTAGLFWGPHWLNGELLATTRDPVCGNRENAVLHLRRGSNLLYGEPEVLTDIWGHYLALPRAAGLTMGPLRLGAVQPEAELRTRRGDVPATCSALEQRLDWVEIPATGNHGVTPARDLAWDRPGRSLGSGLALPLLLDPATAPAGWVLIADFGDEFLGHVQVELTAPAGTVVDVASDERMRGDGLLGLYTSNPFVDGADRIIHAGGRAVLELFHPRGGRYLQIAIRPPAARPDDAAAVEPLELHRLAVRDHQVPVLGDGRFCSADPVFNWTWDASRRTLQACVEDAFLDCPWRERGTYLGDALVEAATLAAVSGDLAIAKRSLRLWAQSQMPDGQMQDSAPSWHRTPLVDFSLLWIVLLHQLWQRDGELGDARRWWPVVGRILASPRYQTSIGVLWDCGPECHLFVDWGVHRADRTGRGNACLNAFRLRALECACELAGAVGAAADAARWQAERSAVLAAFRSALWLPQEGRFAGRLTDSGAADAAGEGLHGNVLALAFGLADAGQEAALLAYVESKLAENCQRALAGRTQGHLELYFLSYLLEGLYRCGRSTLAEAVMREHWGLMRSRGAWTMWETVSHGSVGGGSLCHAWSTTPARWFHERVLGVRPLTAGEPGRWLVAPESALDWAEGMVPVPGGGSIWVAWRRIRGRIAIEATASPGIELVVREEVAAESQVLVPA
jgi:hypothetical protein